MSALPCPAPTATMIPSAAPERCISKTRGTRCAEPFARQLVEANYFEYLKPLLKKRREDLQEAATGVWQLMAMKAIPNGHLHSPVLNVLHITLHISYTFHDSCAAV